MRKESHEVLTKHLNTLVSEIKTKTDPDQESYFRVILTHGNRRYQKTEEWRYDITRNLEEAKNELIREYGDASLDEIEPLIREAYITTVKYAIFDDRKDIEEIIVKSADKLCQKYEAFDFSEDIQEIVENTSYVYICSDADGDAQYAIYQQDDNEELLESQGEANVRLPDGKYTVEGRYKGAVKKKNFESSREERIKLYFSPLNLLVAYIVSGLNHLVQLTKRLSAALYHFIRQYT